MVNGTYRSRADAFSFRHQQALTASRLTASCGLLTDGGITLDSDHDVPTLLLRLSRSSKQRLGTAIIEFVESHFEKAV